MNQAVNENRNLSWKEVENAEVENCNRIKNRTGRLAVGENAVNMCLFYGAKRGNYFGREPVNRTEVEVKVKMKKLKHSKAAGKNEVTAEMIDNLSIDGTECYLYNHAATNANAYVNGMNGMTMV